MSRVLKVESSNQKAKANTYMKLITPTFEESACFPSQQNRHAYSSCQAPNKRGGGDDCNSVSGFGLAPKANGDSDRHNLVYQECVDQCPKMMLVASDSDMNLL